MFNKSMNKKVKNREIEFLNLRLISGKEVMKKYKISAQYLQKYEC